MQLDRLVGQLVRRPVPAEDACAREGVAAAAPDAPSRAVRLNTLACLRDRATIAGTRSDRTAAHDAFREACRLAATTDATWAVRAADNWGRWAAHTGDPATALEAYRAGIAGLRTVLLRQEHRGDKESWLRLSSTMPAETARAAVAIRRPVDAVVALETGRALLLVEALAARPRPSTDADPIDRSSHGRRSGRLAR